MRARIRVFAAPRALLRRLYRVRLTVHHRRLTRAQLRHRCRVHYFVLSFVRCGQPCGTQRGGRGAQGSLSFIPVGMHANGAPENPARAGKTYRHREGRRGRRAHPRAGGENRRAGADAAPVPGSSPRGRGKRRPEGRGRGGRRLIPARAGKTRSFIRKADASAAHPRAGGENLRARRPRARRLGSSPRGRGKPSMASSVPMPARLIPARAGKTRSDHGRRDRARAHPRAGGENSRRARFSEGGRGSSPRGRGKPAVVSQCQDGDRLIPARAGKTCWRVGQRG